jgi:hypothetical protein
VVIADFNVIGISIVETKANPPLVVNRDGVLTLSVTRKDMQSVTRGHLQVLQTDGKVQILEFARGALLDIRWQAFRLTRRIKGLRFAICEALDHSWKLACHVTRVNGYRVECSSSSSTFDRRFAFQVQEMQVLLAGVTGPKAFVMTVNAGAIPAEHLSPDSGSGGRRRWFRGDRDILGRGFVRGIRGQFT